MVCPLVRCTNQHCRAGVDNVAFECQCGAGFCSEACFIKAWLGGHQRACPSSQDIAADAKNKKSQRRGTALIAAVALARRGPGTPRRTAQKSHDAHSIGIGKSKVECSPSKVRPEPPNASCGDSSHVINEATEAPVTLVFPVHSIVNSFPNESLANLCELSSSSMTTSPLKSSALPPEGVLLPSTPAEAVDDMVSCPAVWPEGCDGSPHTATPLPSALITSSTQMESVANSCCVDASPSMNSCPVLVPWAVESPVIHASSCPTSPSTATPAMMLDVNEAGRAGIVKNASFNVSSASLRVLSLSEASPSPGLLLAAAPPKHDDMMESILSVASLSTATPLASECSSLSAHGTSPLASPSSAAFPPIFLLSEPTSFCNASPLATTSCCSTNPRSPGPPGRYDLHEVESVEELETAGSHARGCVDCYADCYEKALMRRPLRCDAGHVILADPKTGWCDVCGQRGKTLRHRCNNPFAGIPSPPAEALSTSGRERKERELLSEPHWLKAFRREHFSAQREKERLPSPPQAPSTQTSLADPFAAVPRSAGVGSSSAFFGDALRPLVGEFQGSSRGGRGGRRDDPSSPPSLAVATTSDQVCQFLLPSALKEYADGSTQLYQVVDRSVVERLPSPSRRRRPPSVPALALGSSVQPEAAPLLTPGLTTYRDTRVYAKVRDWVRQEGNAAQPPFL